MNFNAENHKKMWEWLGYNLPTTGTTRDPREVILEYQQRWIKENNAQDTVITDNMVCNYRIDNVQKCRKCPLLYKCTRLVEDLWEAMVSQNQESIYDICDIIANSPVEGKDFNVKIGKR